MPFRSYSGCFRPPQLKNPRISYLLCKLKPRIQPFAPLETFSLGSLTGSAPFFPFILDSEAA